MSDWAGFWIALAATLVCSFILGSGDGGKPGAPTIAQAIVFKLTGEKNWSKEP